jgi:hypothetical protein
MEKMRTEGVPPFNEESAQKQNVGQEPFGKSRVEFISQTLLPNRVQQNEDGSWTRLTDIDRTQEESTQTGAIYESGKSQYWITSREGDWIKVNETGAKSYLENDRNVPISAPKGEDGRAFGPNPMREMMNFITRTANVEYATTLAGHSTGIYAYGGKRILVISSPQVIKSEPREWSTVRTLLTQLLGEEQLEYFYGWLKIAYESLSNGLFVPGQMLVFVGPADCGKTLLQTKILTPILGGRDARPYQYMTGLTSFNSDLFKGEHLIIADEMPATEYKDRVAFGASIKQLVAETRQRMHAKGKDALTLEPFWRVSMSLNDDQESIMCLPPISDSVRDKMMVFKVTRADILPGDLGDDRKRFSDALWSELPGLLHYLATEHLIKPDIRKGRFGIEEFYHPDIEVEVEEMSAEAELMNIICETVLNPQSGDEEWNGTAQGLSDRLKNSGSTVSREAERLFKSARTLGRMLRRIEKSRGGLKGSVSSRRVNGIRQFSINRRFRNYDRE